MRRFLVLGLVAGGILCAAAEPALGPREQAALDDALRALNVERAELNYEKKWAVDSIFRLAIINRLMDDPLAAPPYADSTSAYCAAHEQDPVALLYFMARATDIALVPADTIRLAREVAARARTGAEAPAAAHLPVPVRGALAALLGAAQAAAELNARAMAALTPLERSRLLMLAPVTWSDENDSLDDTLKGCLLREFGVSVDTAVEVKSETVLAWSRRFDRRAMAQAGIAVASGLGQARAALVMLDPNALAAVPLRDAPGVTGGVLYDETTPLGRVIIGGPGNNIYNTDAALIIDLGGDDAYHGRAGGGVGVVAPGVGGVLDWSGNDLYDGPRVVGLGSGIFGTGFLYDRSGDDTYRGSHHVQGTGLYGVGLFWDEAGRDVSDVGYFAQGAGHFGLGLLIDNDGNDMYRSFNWCQGLGGTWGYGLLLDSRGSDIYVANGKYFHKPLRPFDYRSFAQGFGMGWRPDAGGGIGVLYDREGNDFYNAEIYAQGTSYWYSLGMLIDDAGNDHYLASQYSQAAGIHLSVGLLIDRQGEDQYFSKLGPAQGEGHDLAVGILIDKEGDDTYYCSGGQGMGLTNSFGLLVDTQGDDNYATRDKESGQGSGTATRGFGGLGIFLDLGNEDRYVKTSPGQDQAAWLQATYGAGIDEKGLPKPPGPQFPQVPYDTTPRTIDKVFKDASLWQVGENVDKVAKALDELKRRWAEAIPYVAASKMATKDGLELRAIEELAKVQPDSFKPYLYRAIHDTSRLVRGNAFYLFGIIKATDAVDTLLAALHDPQNRPRTIIGALGEIGAARAAPELLPYLTDRNEVTRIATAANLGRLKNPVATGPLIAALNDRYFTVRSAAEGALGALADTAVAPLLTALPAAPRRAQPHIMRVLGTIATQLDTTARRKERIETRRALETYLDAPDPVLRCYAVGALGAFADDATRAVLREHRADEYDPFVLGQYRAVPGL